MFGPRRWYPPHPATHNRHDGEYLVRAADSRRDEVRQQSAVGNGQIDVAHDGIGRHPLAVGQLDARDRAVVGAAQIRPTEAS